MIRRARFYLFAAACALLGLLAGAGAATKSIDIAVMHDTGVLLTTYTVKETTGKNQPAGLVYIAGQAFRRGDLPPGTYPVFRDANSHLPLIQQLDEIATRRENGDDGSIRHLVFSVQLPAIPANGTYRMEVVRHSGSYSAIAKQSLAALANAHDLKLHLTDVRNQDGSVRGSGGLIFDVNAAAAQTGRDAPRACAMGPVRDCWIVTGPPVDDVTQRPDPLLYVTCYLDLTTARADQTSLGPVRDVCRVDNSWMNVGATNGGWPNDPQAISYRPQLLDGSRSLIDWSWLDASLPSSSNPVVMGGVCGSDYQGVKPNCFRIPGSTGSKAWYFGQAVLFSSTGTPPAGLTKNQLYFIYPIGSANHYQVGDTTLISLQPTPVLTAGPEISPTSQGSGTQNFSFRVWHPHWMSWFTLDPSGAENWTDSVGGLTHSPYLPQFTDHEKLYWEQTGTVIPMLRSQTSTATNSYLDGESLNYTPFGRLNVIGGSGPGDRADLGVINEYAARAFINEAPADWANARLFTLGTVNYPFATILNEATGRVPPVNNGPPVGPGGNGVGVSYPALGAPWPTLTVDGNPNNWSSVKLPLDGVPKKAVTYLGGQWGTSGYQADHEPSFAGLTYLVFGSAHYRDLLYLHGNRMQYVHTYGDDVQYRDHTLFGTHYWGLFANGCCQRRGSFWIFRDTMLAAALGSDRSPERAYFADILKENYNYYQHWLDWKDGSSTNFHTGPLPPNAPGVANDPFIDSYGVSTAYLAYSMLHDPLAELWLQQWVPFYNSICGEQGKGHISSYYCSEFSYAAALHDAGHLITFKGDVGQYYNGVDGSDFGIFPAYATIRAGNGQVTQGRQCARLTVGDLVKVVSIADWNNTSLSIDQLNEDTWYRVIGAIDNAACTFYIENSATPGNAFASFTRAGNPLSDSSVSMIYRPQYAPPTGWFNSQYAPMVGEVVTALKMLGYNVAQAYKMLNVRGITYDNNYASRQWDSSVIVP